MRSGTDGLNRTEIVWGFFRKPRRSWIRPTQREHIISGRRMAARGGAQPITGIARGTRISASAPMSFGSKTGAQPEEPTTVGGPDPRIGDALTPS
jgi:hypothetical protein